MRHRESPLRLSAVLSLRQGRDSRMISQLAVKVVRQFGGRQALPGTWTFSSSSAAVIAAVELQRLGSGSVFGAVLTGEIGQALGGNRLIERAGEICGSIDSPGVYVCDDTYRISSENVPADLWFQDIGLIDLDGREPEHLYRLCSVNEKAPPPRSSLQKWRIPKPADSFVGRQVEIERVAELVSEWFLVTITGLPGAGKSSVAAEAARLLEDEYRDGIFWVDAAECRSDRELIERLNRATSLVRASRFEPFEAICERLRELSALIVFDNCEDLVYETREIVSSLLDSTTTLGVLVTSSVALRLPKERVFALPPMTMPPPGSELETLRKFSSDAIALFSERASRACADFTLTAQNVQIVADLCRHAGGSPLGIEIMASKLGSRSLSTLLRQAHRSLSLRNETPARFHHRSMQVAFNHALRAVPPNLRELTARLSLFSGRFSFEQAVRVWSEGKDDVSFGDDLDALVRASLLMYDPSRGDYELFSPLRSTMRVLYENTEEWAQWSVHFCEKMFGVADEALALFQSGRETPAVVLLDGFVGDVERAIRISFQYPRLHALIPDVFAALPHYWIRRNRLIDADELLSETLLNVAMSPADRVTCMNLIGAAKLRQADFARAEKCFLESAELIEREKITRGIISTNRNLAFIYKERGDFEKSWSCNEAALNAALLEDERIWAVYALVGSVEIGTAWILSQQPPRDPEQVLLKCEEHTAMALERVSTETEPFWLQATEHARGLIGFARGDMFEAEQHFASAALICEAAGFPIEGTHSMDCLAEIEIARGEFERAAKLVGCGLALRVGAGRCRGPVEQAALDRMLEILRIRIGSVRLNDYLQYGASVSIGDLCVVPEHPRTYTPR